MKTPDNPELIDKAGHMRIEQIQERINNFKQSITPESTLVIQ